MESNTISPRNRAERRALEHPRHVRSALTGPQPMKRGRGRPRKDANLISNPPSNIGTSASVGGGVTSEASEASEADETSSIRDDVAPDGVEELQPAWRSVFNRQRRRVPDRAPKRTRAPSGTSDAVITAKLAEYWGMLGLVIMPLSEFDARIIQSRAQVLAEAEVSFARQYSPAALRVLQRITKSTGWFDFAMAHVVTLVPIAANHRIVPATWVLPFAAQYPWIQFTPQPQAQTQPQAQPVQPVQPVQPQPGTQFSPEQIDELTRAAVERAIAQQNGAGSVPPGYNPLDTAPRVEQNPALDYGIRRE